VIDPKQEHEAATAPVPAPAVPPAPAAPPAPKADGSSARRGEPPSGPSAADKAIWERLEDQIRWYDRKSVSSKRWFTNLKLVELVIAASVPAIAAAKGPPAILTVLGALVVVLEGSQHLFQFQEHWVLYRATCEALRHERFLYIAEAGPYARARNRRALLAEHVETLVSREQSKWTATQEDLARREESDHE
jgi:hypothetical protein